MKEYMEAIKLKQVALAKRSGIQMQKLSNLFTGVQEPAYKDLEAIANGLGRPLEYFMDGKPVVLSAFKPVASVPAQHSLFFELAELIHYTMTMAELKPSLQDEF